MKPVTCTLLCCGFGRGRNRQHLARDVAAHHGNHGVEAAAARLAAQHFVVVVTQTKRDVRISEREMADHFADATGFGGIAFEEFEARGRVEKQVANRNIRARRRADFADVHHGARFDDHLRARFGFGFLRRHF